MHPNQIGFACLLTKQASHQCGANKAGHNLRKSQKINKETSDNWKYSIFSNVFQFFTSMAVFCKKSEWHKILILEIK